MDVTLRLLAVALAVLAALAPPAAASPGDLDPSFSGDGRVSTLTSPDTFVARAVAVQPDGQILVGGYSCDIGTCGPTGDSSFRLMRYTRDGGLDPDFGQGGMVTTPIGRGRSQVFDLALEPDGSIVAAGVASEDLFDPGSFALARYRADGILDDVFGNGGTVVTRVGTGFDAVSDLAPQPDGSLVAIGQAEENGRTRVALARYGSRGELDASFGAGGAVVVTGPDRYAFGAGGVVLPDGRIVAVGASGGSRDISDYRLSGVPLSPAGAVGAPWTQPIGGSYSFANAAVALADGRVLSAGVATEAGGRPAMALVRSSAEGALDASWDGDGVALVRARDGTVAADLVLDSGGRAIAAGHANAGSELVFAVARFGPDGQLDRGFGGAGVVLTSFPGTTMARATAVARQANGRLVAAGVACTNGSEPQCEDGTSRLALARYLGDDAGPGGGVPPAAPGGPGATRNAPFVSLPSRLKARRGRVRVLVSCPQAARCRGTLTLRRLRTRRSSLLLARARVSVPARKRRVVVLRLRRRLGPARRIRVRLEFAGSDATGRSRRVTHQALLRR